MATAPKVAWHGLRFSEGAHRYWLDGRSVRGVTTLISNGIPKDAIPYWATRFVGEYIAANRAWMNNLLVTASDADLIALIKRLPWDYRDKRADRGTRIHDLAELLISDPSAVAEVDADIADDVQGHVDFMDATGAVPIFTERSVGSRRYGYAGRLDYLGYLPNLPALLHAQGDERWRQYREEDVHLVDWKTTKAIFPEVGLQCAAYARAEFSTTGGDPREIAEAMDKAIRAARRNRPHEWPRRDYVEHALPQVDHIHGLHVTPTGSLLHPLGDIDPSFEMFLHAKAVADDEPARRQIVCDPLTLVEHEPVAPIAIAPLEESRV